MSVTRLTRSNRDIGAIVVLDPASCGATVASVDLRLPANGDDAMRSELIPS